MDKSNKDKGNLNFLKQENTNLNKSVSRSICSINDNNQDITFMQIDVDYEYITPHFYNYPEDRFGEPLLRIYGVTENNHSVCTTIEGFYPYFYVKMPSNFTEKHLPAFKSHIEEIVRNKAGNIQRKGENVKKVEIVNKTDIYYYQVSGQKFLKITLYFPKHVSMLRDDFEKNFSFFNLEFEKRTYESKINFPLRYMIDNEIVGMSWVELPKKKYNIMKTKISTCQIEASINYMDLVIHKPEGKYAKVAPLRILSFDIECAAKDGKFPTAKEHPVIQIANICKEFGQTEPFVQKIFTLKSCADIPHAEVHSFEKETDMLNEWRDFIIDLDPDIITGYNIINFDFPYLIERAETLKIKDFNKLSRIKNQSTKVKLGRSQAKVFGDREYKDINISGRIQLDMFIYILREFKLRSYSLNNVSSHLLGDQKEDVHHKMIYELWQTNEFTRRRLAVYCLKDAYLPLKLMDKLTAFYNLVEMCRVTCTPLNFILRRGQQIKVVSQLHRKVLSCDIVIPSIKISKAAFDDEEGFQGADVLEPQTGFYEHPIATLDFASLYPSIMICHNLCYSTLIKKEDVNNFSKDDYITTPNGDHFIKEHIRKGILPQILEELLSARKKAKEELKLASDPEMKAVLDGRQLALKISANSVYGFTGAQIGQLPCLEISSSVTSFGREMINTTKEKVEQYYCKENGWKEDAKVIYGDTDSVMVKFGVKTLQEAMELGKQASEIITKYFKKPIKLEFEKVYYPYLLMNKKRYAGLIWTRTDKYDKIDTKGFEAVRRDVCGLVKDIMNHVLNKILIERNINGAVQYIKDMISDLLMNRIDISLLVISKTISKKTDDGDDTKGKKKNTYVQKQAHTELAEKMKKRDEGNAPSIGDRVQYVIIKGAKGSQQYQNAEDPQVVLEKDLCIDTNYYLNNQLKKPLLRVFKCILNDAELTLFSGDHMKFIYVPRNTSNNSSFGNFTYKRNTCLSCKTTINTSGALCVSCSGKKRELFIERKLEANYYERLFCDLWTECQKCQGSLLQDVICQNRDCPIYFKRIKTKKDLKETYDVLKRFSE